MSARSSAAGAKRRKPTSRTAASSIRFISTNRSGAGLHESRTAQSDSGLWLDNGLHGCLSRPVRPDSTLDYFSEDGGHGVAQLLDDHHLAPRSGGLSTEYRRLVGRWGGDRDLRLGSGLVTSALR